MADTAGVAVYVGPALAAYGFPDGHPFSTARLGAFWTAAQAAGLADAVAVIEPRAATREVIELFHTPVHVARVAQLSASGRGLLDGGDTPAFPGVYEAAATVVGCAVDAVERIVSGAVRRAFVPIGGLHHARRDRAAGFCVFNDCGVAIEVLRRRYGCGRVAYVDIDAHHGDGVYYGFEADPAVVYADLHEDGRFLYPGTGSAQETGVGAGTGTKLNLPLPPGAGDREFHAAWNEVEAHLARLPPDFIVLQCGADSIAGDPLTHLRYSPAAHAHATRRLCRVAEATCAGRLLALGGGGYDLGNIGRAWTAVLGELCAADARGGDGPMADSPGT